MKSVCMHEDRYFSCETNKWCFACHDKTDPFTHVTLYIYRYVVISWQWNAPSSVSRLRCAGSEHWTSLNTAPPVLVVAWAGPGTAPHLGPIKARRCLVPGAGWCWCWWRLVMGHKWIFMMQPRWDRPRVGLLLLHIAIPHPSALIDKWQSVFYILFFSSFQEDIYLSYCSHINVPLAAMALCSVKARLDLTPSIFSCVCWVAGRQA